jgi:D-alanine-D-alanine ligase
MTRIAIAYDDYGLVAPESAPGVLSEAAVLDCVAEIEDACRAAGWETCRIEVGSGRGRGADWHRRLFADLQRAHPDAVVNFVESVNGDARLEVAACWLLELAGIPYTGAPPRALALALEKVVAKSLLQSAGLPVARGFMMETGNETVPKDLRWPLFVKPSREDASNGIAQESVVETVKALRARVKLIGGEFRQPCLVEEYVDGREINVSLLGEGRSLRALPLAEIDFTGYPEGSRHIVTFDAKWNLTSAEYHGSVSVAAQELPDGMEDRITEIAMAAHRVIGLRDYARVDMRLDPERGPVILEVNPNPDCSSDAGLTRTAERAGISHRQLLQRIIRCALERRARAAA